MRRTVGMELAVDHQHRAGLGGEGGCRGEGRKFVAGHDLGAASRGGPGRRRYGIRWKLPPPLRRLIGADLSAVLDHGRPIGAGRPRRTCRRSSRRRRRSARLPSSAPSAFGDRVDRRAQHFGSVDLLDASARARIRQSGASSAIVESWLAGKVTVARRCFALVRLLHAASRACSENLPRTLMAPSLAAQAAVSMPSSPSLR